MSETFLSSTGINARYLAIVIVNGKHILIGTRAFENLKPHLQCSTIVTALINYQKYHQQC
jgi:hypothetical protein